MAIISVDFFSTSVMRTIPIKVILPVDKLSFPPKPVTAEKPCFKTLYLLHGIFGDDTDWITGTRINRWAMDRNLCVVMPAGENNFYLDNETTKNRYSTLIGQELVNMTRKMFPLSDKKEDTFIAGLSMGGFGAIVNGLTYSDTFGYIAGLSSGLILETVNGHEGAGHGLMDEGQMEAIFGPKDKIKGSKADYYKLAKDLKDSGKELPKMYLCCGVDDALLASNKKYADYLKEIGFDVTYVEGPGNHEWDFWDRYILKILDWLPLGEVSQGISSGHVSD